MKLFIMQSSPGSCNFLPLRFKYSPQHPFSTTRLGTEIYQLTSFYSKIKIPFVIHLIIFCTTV